MRVVIVGAGLLGLTLGYELAQRGAEVEVLDARACGLGASAVNAGWVVRAAAAPVPAPGLVLKSLKWMTRKDSPLYIKPSLDPAHVRFMVRMWRHCNVRDFREGFAAQLALAESTNEMLDDYVRDGVTFESHSSGLLMAFLNRHNLDHHLDELDIAASFGLDPQVHLGDAVREIEPALRDGMGGGIYFPHERHLDPVQLTTSLRRRITELGGTITENSPVDRVERLHERIVAIRSGERRFAGDAFVVAAGAWSGRVAGLFGSPLPIRPGKGYAVDIAPPPIELRGAINLSDAKVAVTPYDGRLRLSGTMEFAGLDEVVNDARVQAIAQAPCAYFPDYVAPSPVPVAGGGMRPMTPDGLPIIGSLPGTDNAYVSSGHGMLGLTLAPGTARALATRILGGALPPRLLPFRPARFIRQARPMPALTPSGAHR